MKKMMQSLFLGTALLGAAAAYAGQGNEHHGHRGMDGKSRIHYLEKKLNLSEEQKTAIEAIHSTYDKGDKKSQRHHFMREISQLDPAAADYDEQVAAIAKERAAQVEQSIIERAQMHAKVYEVLTPEQRQQLKELKAKRQERMKAKE